MGSLSANQKVAGEMRRQDMGWYFNCILLKVDFMVYHKHHISEIISNSRVFIKQQLFLFKDFPALHQDSFCFKFFDEF